MAKTSILFQFWDFFKTRKKWWLVPLVLVLLLLAALLVFTASPALAPFLYPLF